MKRQVKMVRLQFPDKYVSEMPDDIILEMYKQHSKLMDDNSNFPLQKGTDWREWYDLDKSTDEHKQFKIDNPCYSAFKLVMEYDKFGDLEFSYHNKLDYTVIERFMIELSYDFDISHINEYVMNSQESILKLMQKQIDSIAAIGKSAIENSQHYNIKCGSPTSDEFLYKVNQTMILYNTCTDELQGKLKDGWRILNITPQPDQRRPDYVLGRYNPNENEVDNVAERG